jgi:hypothetical protein
MHVICNVTIGGSMIQVPKLMMHVISPSYIIGCKKASGINASQSQLLGGLETGGQATGVRPGLDAFQILNFYTLFITSNLWTYV